MGRAFTNNMPAIRNIPYRAWLLAAFVVVLAISAIKPLNSDDFLLQHALTGLFILGLLLLLERRPPTPALSNAAYTLIFVYLLLHVLGARYSYSMVPYDRWVESLCGTTVSELIGADSYTASDVPRNYYDRLVHFLFGLLLLLPTGELVQRWTGLRGAWRFIVAGMLLCVLGTLYEIVEWLIAVMLSPETAERYNGQQGDLFDAQKDLALNIGGSIIAGAVIGMGGLLRRD